MHRILRLAPARSKSTSLTAGRWRLSLVQSRAPRHFHPCSDGAQPLMKAKRSDRQAIDTTRRLQARSGRRLATRTRQIREAVAVVDPEVCGTAAQTSLQWAEARHPDKAYPSWWGVVNLGLRGTAAKEQACSGLRLATLTWHVICE